MAKARRRLAAQGHDYLRYEGQLHRLRAGGDPCENWGDHPIDCIREVALKVEMWS
jgi:hypothetical protein